MRKSLILFAFVTLLLPSLASASFGVTNYVRVVSTSTDARVLEDVHGTYKYDGTTLYENLGDSTVTLDDTGIGFEIDDDGTAVYESASFFGDYTATSTGTGTALVATSTLGTLEDDLQGGFGDLVDVAVNFIGDNIELIVGVMVTLAVFSWLIGWLFGAFRRR